MKPFKSGKPLANWLLRIALMINLYLIYFNAVTTLNFSNRFFLLAFFALVAGGANIIGGMLTKPLLTIISGLVIWLLSGYKMIVSFDGLAGTIWLHHFIPFAIGFYFLTNGNDK
ncbi:MAG: hypothetical protein Q8928_00930 [Bacteroidota bacterium]|nr:hypothetical protein [Bacteroidota bacterium]